MFLSLSDDVLALFDKQTVNIRVSNLLLQRETEESFCSGIICRYFGLVKLEYVTLQFIFLLHVYKYLFGLYTFECSLKATFINTEFKLDSNLRTIPSLKGNGHIFVKW